jgi:competence protein ComGC
MYIPNVVKIDQLVQKLKGTHTHRDKMMISQADIFSLKREKRLKNWPAAH